MIADHVLPLNRTVAPADQAEVAELLAQAYRDETPVYAIGGGTSLDYGAMATAPGLGLKTTDLTRIVDYPARDMTITVEAGITMARLMETLAAQGHRLPVDCPQADRATLGGVIATNTSGPRRFGQGTMRDYVIGISAIDGRGVTFKGGGRVVKNVAGYDFCKLLTGSLGTVGLITQVTLKLKPVPEASAFLACAVNDEATAERLLAALVTSRTTPTAIEWLVGPAWADEAALDGLAMPAAGRLVVGFEGTAIEVAWQIDELAREWRALGISTTTVVESQRAVELWRRLTEFSAAPPAPLNVQITVLPGKLSELVAALRRRDPQCSVLCHAGNGVATVRFASGPPRPDDRGWWEQFLWGAASRGAGHAVVLAAAERELRTADKTWGPPDGSRRLMREIKQQFDPKGLLNPGRFVY